MWTQRFITWLTGVPYKDQQPLFVSKPLIELAATVGWFGFAIGIGFFATESIVFSNIV